VKRYEAVVTREGKWWMVSVPEIAGLTQARRLSEAPLMARELIAATLDAPLEAIDVVATVEVIGPVTGIQERLARIADERMRAAELDRSASREAVELARELSRLDIPLRDIGAMLGVSHQRAHQLVHG
jgi:hypothetical protein